MPDTYTLQLLHYYGESGLLGVETAPIMGALIDKFDDEYANTLVVGEGDSYIPGPWLVGGADPSLSAVPGIGSTALGRPDIAIMNAFGTDFSALGNHEFDLGSPVLQSAISASGAWVGAQFPLITDNLDFSADSALRGLADASLGGTATNAFAGKETSDINGKIAPYAVVTEGGEKIGVVGLTTFDLLIKSSPNGTVPESGMPPATTEEGKLAEAAGYVQAAVDALEAAGVNKIVMVDQLDTIERNKLLAPMVHGIDVMIAGGGHERMGDATDTAVAFNGHSADFVADAYPIVTAGSDGKSTLIVTTDTEYTYLGRLVVEFDANGELIVSSLDPVINGAYASTEATLQSAYGTTDSAADIVAGSSIGSQVAAITTAIDDVIKSKDGTFFGYTDVYLEGDRAFGRAQEVNLGDITADANLYTAQQALGDGLITSLKNGGGIRASIGSIDEDGTKIPPIANPDALKPAGAISQLDIENALRFDNKLMVFDTTPQGLKNILEYAAGLPAGNGGYMQIGGIHVSFDPDNPAGSKVLNAALVDLDGTLIAPLIVDGAISPAAPATISMVCLNFTANGGDGYPIKANAENFRYLLSDGTLSAPIDEALDFTAVANVPANAIGEQKAFEDFLEAFHATPETAYDMADTPASQDVRIQNLNVRPDAVFEGEVLVGSDDANGISGGSGDQMIFGLAGDDTLSGGSGNDLVDGGADNDNVSGGSGDDTLRGGDGDDNLDGGSGNDSVDGGDGNDSINAGSGNDEVQAGDGNDTVLGFNGNDVIDTGDGNDSANGGNGGDTVDGGAGNDTLDGGNGNDSVAGGSGDDVLLVSSGNDTLDGGEGTDAVDFGAFDSQGLGLSFDLASGAFTATTASMIAGRNGYTAVELFTIGESANGFTPTGIPDGIGAYSPEDGVLRLLFNSEIQDQQGYAYTVNGDVDLTGARVSYFDIDLDTLEVLDGGLAYDEIIGYLGTPIESAAELGIPLSMNLDGSLNYQGRPDGAFGFDRFCSSALFEANEFGDGQGFADRIYFGPQETDDGVYVPIDVDNGVAYVAPALGYGAWENLTTVNTGDPDTVGLLLGDDTSGAPLYLYVGTKDAGGDFLARNGLAEGNMYVWVPTDGDQNGDGKVDPRDYNGTGTSISGGFVAIDYYDPAKAGTPGWDAFGYALQDTMYDLAADAGAMVFARIEDLSTNPENDNEAVFAATGRSNDFDAVDTWGTVYTVQVSFEGASIDGDVNILYDADDDPAYQLRSPDNLDWADDGFIYVQEDRSATWSDVAGINPNEASIVRFDPDAAGGDPTQIAEIDRSSVVPPGTTDPSPNDLGNWETSGILDISEFFGLPGGSVFVADVQAHSLTNGIIAAENLVQGGQLNLIYGPGVEPFGPPASESGTLSLTGIEGIIGTRYSDELRGDGGDNILDGAGGNDTLGGRQGDDTLSGGDGNDSLGGSDGDDILHGGEGHDDLGGGAGDDTLAGDAGDDTINAGDGSDSLSGDAGDDVLNANDGDDTISGGDGNDKISAHQGDDSVDGGAGNDTIGGGQGDDALFGGEDDDELNGYQGDDELVGGTGNDELLGGAGDDVLVGGEGENTVTGGEGDDIFVLTGGEGFDLITDFTVGADLIGLTGGVTFDDLTFAAIADGTAIIADGATLAELAGVSADTLSDADFILV